MKRFHGIDEKISKENYKEIIEFSYHLIKELNGLKKWGLNNEVFQSNIFQHHYFTPLIVES